MVKNGTGGVPLSVASNAMKLLGHLGKEGASEFEAVCAVVEYLRLHAEIGNPFAYFRPGTASWGPMTLRWGMKFTIDEKDREEKLTKAWAAGRAS